MYGKASFGMRLWCGKTLSHDECGWEDLGGMPSEGGKTSLECQCFEG